MKRVVVGLRSAWLHPDGPGFTPKRLRGMKAKGMTFERKVTKALTKAFGFSYMPNPWILFEDANGKGFAQPDGVLASLRHMIVIEAKLSQRVSAERELTSLYAPLVKMIWNKPLVLVQAFRFCSRSDVNCVAGLLALAPREEVYTWQHL